MGGPPRRRAIAWFYLGLGIACIVAFGILIVSGITGILFIESLGLDLTFVLWYLLFGIGLALVAKTFIVSRQRVHENTIGFSFRNRFPEAPRRDVHFWSIAWSRLLAALILAGIGVANILILSLNLGEDTEYGRILFLGGPSPAYLTGIYPAVFGVLLLGYFFTSINRIHLFESEHWWFFCEGRVNLPHLTEIPKSEVEGLQFRNTKFGGKFAWVLILIPFIVLNIGYGIIFLFGPLPSAHSVELGWILVGNGILAIPALVLLLQWRQHFLEIITDTKRYEKYFFPPIFRKDVLPQIQIIFGVEPRALDLPGPSIPSPASVVQEGNQSGPISSAPRFRLLAGILFVGIAAFARLTYSGIGMLVSWGLLFYGSILVVNALARDRSTRSELAYDKSPRDGIFHYTWHRGQRYEHVLMHNVISVEHTTGTRALDAFDIFGSLFLASILGVHAGQTLVFPAAGNYAWETMVGGILSAGIIILLLFYHLAPQPVVRVVSPSLIHALPVRDKPPKVDRQGIPCIVNDLRGYVAFLSSPQGRGARRRLFLLVAVFLLSIGASAAYWSML